MKTLSFLAHWFYLIRATAWLLAAFLRATFYFKKKAFQDLDLPHPETLTSKEKRRLKHYFYGTTYLSMIFGSLHGRFRSPDEKHLFTNLASLAYFFDDLADSYQNSNDWENAPEAYGAAADDDRKLALHFLSNIYKKLPPADLVQFRNYMHRVFNIETEGRQRTDKKLTINDLSIITAEKGGCSVLLFRRVLANPISVEEERALFEFGYLIQLCDDIFDVWFDVQDGVQTLPLRLLEQKKVVLLQEIFEKQVQTVQWHFRAIDLPKIQIETALRVVHFVVSVTRVCLRHYYFLAKNTDTLPLQDREKMVVDMEKWQNRWWTAVYLVFRGG